MQDRIRNMAACATERYKYAAASTLFLQEKSLLAWKFSLLRGWRGLSSQEHRLFFEEDQNPALRTHIRQLQSQGIQYLWPPWALCMCADTQTYN